MIREDNDRRWKTARIRVTDILNQFIRWGMQGDCFSQMAFDSTEFPEGYTIDDVWYDMADQAWWLLVHHPSFDIVPLGQHPPMVPCQVDSFFLPKIRSIEEARKTATWMYKSETDRLREMLADVVT